MNDRTAELAERIADATARGTPLSPRGGGTRGFLGRAVTAEPLDLAGHAGIVNYEPTELVLTARAGTPLDTVASTLAEQGQMLPFEPPRFGAGSTLGGAIATGLSGPRRPWAGATRDLVLGTRLINGRGEAMRFGGEVMKNVAGYDVSRLVTGSHGTLGVITEVSMKVLPLPEAEAAVSLEIDEHSGFRAVESAYRAGVPVTGSAHDGQRLHVRLSGTERAVTAGCQHLGGEHQGDPTPFWQGLRDHQLAFFTRDGPPLWRLSVPMLSETPNLQGERLTDWNGQQHWLRTAESAEVVFAEATRLGGHATCYAGAGDDAAFQPLGTAIHRLHQRLKAAFDPARILNPGRLYADL